MVGFVRILILSKESIYVATATGNQNVDQTKGTASQSASWTQGITIHNVVLAQGTANQNAGPPQSTTNHNTVPAQGTTN